MESPSLFDGCLYPSALSARDLESMRAFGVTAALATCSRFPVPSAKELLRQFDDLVGKQLSRLARAGIRGYVALGVPPGCILRRGLGEVLSKLPSYFKGGQVVAVGAVGLGAGGDEELEAFTEQLALAKRLQLPVLVQAPLAQKEAMTRRELSLLKSQKINPRRVAIDGASPKTLGAIIACDFLASLPLHPDEMAAESAVSLVRKFGSRHLAISSHAGLGASDILTLPRFASLLNKSRLSAKVSHRACYTNWIDFLDVAPTVAP